MSIMILKEDLYCRLTAALPNVVTHQNHRPQGIPQYPPPQMITGHIYGMKYGPDRKDELKDDEDDDNENDEDGVVA